MKDTALYEQLLGLKSPWSVKSVDLSLTDQRVEVEVVLKRGQVWVDPTDETKRAPINGWHERQWRHLDTCQFETMAGSIRFATQPVEGLWIESLARFAARG